MPLHSSSGWALAQAPVYVQNLRRFIAHFYPGSPELNSPGQPLWGWTPSGGVSTVNFDEFARREKRFQPNLEGCSLTASQFTAGDLLDVLGPQPLSLIHI